MNVSSSIPVSLPPLQEVKTLLERLEVKVEARPSAGQPLKKRRVIHVETDAIALMKKELKSCMTRDPKIEQGLQALLRVPHENRESFLYMMKNIILVRELKIHTFGFFSCFAENPRHDWSEQIDHLKPYLQDDPDSFPLVREIGEIEEGERKELIALAEALMKGKNFSGNRLSALAELIHTLRHNEERDSLQIQIDKLELTDVNQVMEAIHGLELFDEGDWYAIVNLSKELKGVASCFKQYCDRMARTREECWKEAVELLDNLYTLFEDWNVVFSLIDEYEKMGMLSSLDECVAFFPKVKNHGNPRQTLALLVPLVCYGTIAVGWRKLKDIDGLFAALPKGFEQDSAACELLQLINPPYDEQGLEWLWKDRSAYWDNYDSYLDERARKILDSEAPNPVIRNYAHLMLKHHEGLHYEEELLKKASLITGMDLKRS